MIEFASKKVRDAWSHQVVEAVRVKHPDVLAGDQP